MTLVDRFLKYVSFDTQSDESTGITPSTPKQMVFAEYLKTELESLGLEDITLDEHGYLFATLPANIDKDVPTIGFIAHMDTSPDMSGKDVTPRIVEKYDGSDIMLCAEDNIILSPVQFPELLDHKGEDLIVTNGKTLFENFNAAAAKILFKGRNVHPGYAKNKMINSIYLANQFITLLPSIERPEHTTGYEGFYHLIGIQGEVEQCTVSYIIRDHDRAKFEERKKEIERLVARMNTEYGEGTVTLELRDQYYNMREKIEPVMHIIDIAFAAMEAVGVKPNVKPIRGGTDGAQLSFKGLPCPNIFAGGLNFHGRYEFVPIQNMEKAMNVIVKIAELVASR